MADTLTDVSGAAALAKISVSTDGGTIYNAIPGLRAPAMPETTTETYDVTDTDVTDNFRKYLGGWSDKGEASITVNFAQATYVQLKALSKTAVLDWKIEYTDAAQTTTDPSFTFQGTLSAGPTVQMPMDDAWTIDFSIKGSGDDTFTAGTV